MRFIKTFFLTLAGTLLLSLPTVAQPSPAAPSESCCPADRSKSDPDNKEKLESARIAFFTTKMELTPEEAGKFWPVYNEYRKAIGNARKASRDRFHQIRRMTEEGSASEVAVKKLLMEYIDGCREDDDLERLYLDEFLKILPAEKVAMMYVAEEEFRVKMIKMWKKPGMDNKKP